MLNGILVGQRNFAKQNRVKVGQGQYLLRKRLSPVNESNQSLCVIVVQLSCLPNNMMLVLRAANLET